MVENYCTTFGVYYHTSFFPDRPYRLLTHITGEISENGSHLVVQEPWVNDLLEQFAFYITDKHLTITIHYIALLELAKNILYIVALLNQNEVENNNNTEFSAYNYEILFRDNYLTITFPLVENVFFLETLIDPYETNENEQEYTVLKIAKETAQNLAMRFITDSAKCSNNLLKAIREREAQSLLNDNN